jgi:hypothetical protein
MIDGYGGRDNPWSERTMTQTEANNELGRLRTIPEFVLGPGNTFEVFGIERTIEPRPLRVYGYGTYMKCLGCGRVGLMDALMFKPDSWPNVAIICGTMTAGCGVFWGMIPEPPEDVVWTYREPDAD